MKVMTIALYCGSRRRIRIILCLLMVFLCPGSLLPKPLDGTLSPNGKYAIFTNGATTNPEELYIADAITGEPRGWIIKKNEGGATNVQIESRWNNSSSRVAILLQFGTKGSHIEIFSQDSSGSFVATEFTRPEIFSIIATKNIIPSSARQTASFDRIGDWTAENCIKLLSGDARVVPPSNTILTVFASYMVVLAQSAEVKDVQSFGPFGEDETETFLANWNGK